jgi:hypothetical protein
MKLSDLVWGIVGGIAAVIFTTYWLGCNSAPVQGGVYATNLEECNRNATSLCESITCENSWRLKANRTLRDVPAHCKNNIKDGGEQ